MLRIKSLENFTINLFLLFSLTLCQDTILVADSDVHEESNNSTVQNTIPEMLLIQMKDVKSLSDLLSRFVVPEDNFSLDRNNQTSITESRRALSAAAASAIAEPANCKTEPQVVQLDKTGNGATIYWPSCVRVRRCSGCCPSTMLACKPLATSILNVTVLHLQYNHQSPGALESQGTRVFSLEQHDRCACGCKEGPEDCDPDVHDYRQHECKCVCKNSEEAASCNSRQKIWDSKSCLCKCRNVRLCSSGRYFNIITCRCEVLRRSLAIDISSFSNSSLSTLNASSTTTR